MSENKLCNDNDHIPSEMMTPNELHIDNVHIPLEAITSVEANKDVITPVETQKNTNTEYPFEESVEEPTGRIYNENGCLVSARRSKKKTSDDFVYHVYYV